MIYKTIDLKAEYPATEYEGYLDVYCCETSNDPPERKYPAMIICPGGGYAYCAKIEGEPIMAAFFSAGVQCFVLRYSAARSEPPVYYPTEHLQLAAAFDWVRRHADEYKIDKDTIGLIGFSAGGHLAGSFGAGLWHSENYADTLGVERENLRPNALALGYSVLSLLDPTNDWTVKNLLADRRFDENEKARLSFENIVGEFTPPTYLWHTSTDDIVPVECSIRAMSALAAHKIPFQARIFPEGGHGLSRATRLTSGDLTKIPPRYIADWMRDCTDWFLRVTGYEENPR